MEYVGRVPAPPLDRFIDDIYCLTGVPGHRRMVVPPMPSAHLVINLGEPARLWDSDPSVPSGVLADGWFMGVWTIQGCKGVGDVPGIQGVQGGSVCSALQD